jgi:hypothetical protein
VGSRHHLYIRILTCFVYLAVILDVFSRKAVGYALSRNLDSALALDALRMAIKDREPKPGCIHHSDRGIQYAAGDYVKDLKTHNFQISMSRKGNPYDNAYAESFIKTLKAEEVCLWEYRTMEDVQKRIPYFIEDVYNRKRLYSSLGYRSPCEFEEMIPLTHNPCQDTLIALPEAVQLRGVSPPGQQVLGYPENKGIIAIYSTYTDKDGKLQSRIKPTLPQGEIVTIARTDTSYIVTEYGVAFLKGLSIPERVIEIAKIAHPDFRDWLLEEARKIKWLGKSFRINGLSPEQHVARAAKQ